MTVITSQTTSKSNLIQKIVLVNINEKIEAPHYCLFVRGIQWWLASSLTKGQ